MGNYISCSPVRSAKARVVVPGGQVQNFHDQVKVAELMLEHSSIFFLVNAESLRVGRRFYPLSADQDIELGQSYVMFPMKRVNSFVTAADVPALFMVGKVESVGMCVLNKCSYENRALEGWNDLNLRGKCEGFGSGVMVSMETNSYCRLSSCRSRRPSLETIIEEREPGSAR